MTTALVDQLRADAAATRAGAVRAPADRPRQRRSDESPASAALVRAEMRGVQIREAQNSDGADVVRVEGYASITEHGYEMWDFYGPYTEIVSQGAFGKTLAAEPQVEYVINHGAGGAIPMAHTRNGTLTLAEDASGLLTLAELDPRRSDVQLVRLALERGDLAEMSFKFRITAGQWSPDYTEYRITEVDIDRGDVSIVNFGANPATSVSVRSEDVLRALDRMSPAQLADIEARLAARRGETETQKSAMTFAALNLLAH